MFGKKIYNKIETLFKNRDSQIDAMSIRINNMESLIKKIDEKVNPTPAITYTRSAKDLARLLLKKRKTSNNCTIYVNVEHEFLIDIISSNTE